MRFIHYHLVHIADKGFTPQVTFDGKRTKTDNLLIKHSAKINLPLRAKGTVIDAAKRNEIQWLAWPKLTQKSNDAVKVLCFALSYGVWLQRSGLFVVQHPENCLKPHQGGLF